MASCLELEVSLTKPDGDGGATLMTRHALLTKYLCFYIHRLAPPTPGIVAGRVEVEGLALVRHHLRGLLCQPVGHLLGLLCSHKGPSLLSGHAHGSPRDIRVRLGCASNLAGPCAQLRTPAPARATRRRRAANRPSSSHPCPSPVTPGVSRRASHLQSAPHEHAQNRNTPSNSP